jgi:hypothetical protein
VYYGIKIKTKTKILCAMREGSNLQAAEMKFLRGLVVKNEWR